MARGAAAGSGVHEAYVAVSVATLWREPGIHRELDCPALANPADPRGWLAAMTVEDKRGLVGRVETQVLFGQRVLVVDRRGPWVRAIVPDQGNPEEPRGYPGWLPSWQLAEDPVYGALLRGAEEAAASGTASGTAAPSPEAPGASAGAEPPKGLVAVRALATWLHHAPDPDARFVELSFETRLPLLAEEGEWLAVAVPTGRLPALGGPGVTPGVAVAWLRRASVTVLPAEAGNVGGASGASGTALLDTARQFLGVPYLWGGTSGFGVDCSGFVYLVHRAHGLLIPRDAGPQRDHGGGRPVEREALRPGDLVFFAHDGGRGAVHHVAMYAGDGRMIHAPNSERPVEEIPLDTPPYGDKYAGARRYHAG
ncbi:MAG TPA: C40 family peptidase [Thermaerobacter sp.]